MSMTVTVSRHIRLTIVAGLALGVLMTDISAAYPQSGALQGEKPVSAPHQVDLGQTNALPSVGNSGRSSAPTMVFDCENKPKDCNPPITSSTDTPTPEFSEKPATKP